MKTSIVLTSCTPSPRAVRTLQEFCLRTLHARRLERSMQDVLLSALEEIVDYIIGHANPSPTRLSAELMKEDNHWLLEIRDDGGVLPNPFTACATATTASIQKLGRLFVETSYLPGNSQTDNCFRMRHAELLTKARIVVVDDDPGLRGLIKLYLQDEYQVRDYPDATSALAALDSEQVDLVISDIYMPGMDGLAFRRRLAEYSYTDLLPFIFITASNDEVLLHQAGDLGIDDYLLKPIRKRQLLATIRRVLQRSRRVRERLGDLLEPNIAITLRRALPLQLGRFRCILRTRSASSGGGDLLSHTHDPKGDTLILAEVLGQGPQAKFFAHAHAGYLAGLIRTLPTSAGPAATLSRLSKDIKADPILQSTLVNCLAVRLDSDGHIRLTGAGQPLPVLVEAGSTHYVEIHGLPPGLSNTIDYAETTLYLQPGQRLLLYTDGLLEGNGSVTAEQFRHIVRESATLPLAEAADYIMQTTKPCRDDDATLILLEDMHS